MSTVQNYIGLKHDKKSELKGESFSTVHIEHHAPLTEHIDSNMFFYFAHAASDDFIAGGK